MDSLLQYVPERRKKIPINYIRNKKRVNSYRLQQIFKIIIKFYFQVLSSKLENKRIIFQSNKNYHKRSDGYT